MIKINKSTILVISLSLFAFIAYNIMDVDALESKQVCKDHDGEWKNDECKFEKDSKYPKEQNKVDFEHYMAEHDLWDDYIEEKAAQEDAICDNEDADTTNIDICKSEEWTEAEYQEEKYRQLTSEEDREAMKEALKVLEERIDEEDKEQTELTEENYGDKYSRLTNKDAIEAEKEAIKNIEEQVKNDGEELGTDSEQDEESNNLEEEESEPEETEQNEDEDN
jgi:hypothetical protein